MWAKNDPRKSAPAELEYAFCARGTRLGGAPRPGRLDPATLNGYLFSAQRCEAFAERGFWRSKKIIRATLDAAPSRGPDPTDSLSALENFHSRITVQA
jgi:hypothetical protein